MREFSYSRGQRETGARATQKWTSRNIPRRNTAEKTVSQKGRQSPQRRFSGEQKWTEKEAARRVQGALQPLIWWQGHLTYCLLGHSRAQAADCPASLAGTISLRGKQMHPVRWHSFHTARSEPGLLPLLFSFLKTARRFCFSLGSKSGIRL